MTFSKPIRIGFTIYDSSKLFMIKTYYNELQSIFGENKFKGHHMITD